MSNGKNIKFIIFLLLTVLCGIVINYPYHNFQSFLAQGDHGRDLYAAAAVLRGEMPYKDFWWVYGPLMPYYYGLMFKLYGMQISSVLLGKIFLNIIAGLGIYLAMTRFFSPLAGFVAGLWFLVYHQDFFFTYNHAGGIMLLTLAVWMHWSYVVQHKIRDAFLALLFTFVLGLIKINFALTTLLIGVMTVLVTDWVHRRNMDTYKKIFYTLAVLGLPLAWYGVYTIFLQGLTVNEIRQCLPYLGGDEPYNSVGPLQTIPQWIQIILTNIRSSWISLGLCALIVFATIQTTLHIITTKDKTLILLIGYAIFFYLLNMHEFIKSGVFYRLFWTQPLSVLLTYIMIATAATRFARPIQWLLWTTLCIIAASSVFSSTQMINAYKTPAHFFGSDRGQVYITNDRNWIQTVVLTTKALKSTLNNNATFLALPYDCLYYYLTDRKSPTRQLIFFDHIKIPLEQEGRILQELETQHIPLIVLSSRHSAHEHGLGTLGVTYCPMIAQYINSSFAPTTKIGDWTNEPGWAWNHGTYIFKRKDIPHDTQP